MPCCVAQPQLGPAAQVLLVGKRRTLGRAAQLADKDAHELWSSAANECRPFKDPAYDLRRVVRDSAVQAASSSRDAAVQVRRAVQAGRRRSLQARAPVSRRRTRSLRLLRLRAGLLAVAPCRRVAGGCGRAPCSTSRGT
jgi:hypothetical protein